MSISLAQAKKLNEALSGQPFCPTTPAGWTVLHEVLAEVSTDLEHAKRIIAEALQITDAEGCARCATPQDIRRIGVSTRDRRPEPDPDCEKCGGTGQRIVRRAYQGPIPAYQGTEVEAAAKCECWAIRPVRDVYSTPWRKPAGGAKAEPVHVEAKKL